MLTVLLLLLEVVHVSDDFVDDYVPGISELGQS